MSFVTSKLTVFTAIVLAVVMGAFGTHAIAQSGNGYNVGQLRGNVDSATVLQTRTVQVEQAGYQERAIGTAIGGAIGAAAGHALTGKNRSTSSRLLASGLGAAIGGVAGNKVTQHMATRDAQEIVLQTPNGRTYSVVQPMPAESVNPGDQVRVLQQGGQTRVIRMSGYQQRDASPNPYADEQGYRLHQQQRNQGTYEPGYRASQPLQVRYANPYENSSEQVYRQQQRQYEQSRSAWQNQSPYFGDN